MTDAENGLRALVSELLSSGEVSLVIGYGSTGNPLMAGPVFIRKPEDAQALVWNPFCRGGLAKYLLEYRGHKGRIGIIAKACDTRSIARMVNDNRIRREDVFVISPPCPGIAREDAFPDIPRRSTVAVLGTGSAYAFGMPDGTVLEMDRSNCLDRRCLHCATEPVLADARPGEGAGTVPGTMAWDQVFAGVLGVEGMPVAERRDFWRAQFAKCIRCYACRNACPACSCRECCFDAVDAGWLGKGADPDANEAYHVTRAFHAAGRCTGCGECERACPVGIPLGLLNAKVAKDMAELFGTAAPGTDVGEVAPFRTYSLDDPEEFM